MIITRCWRAVSVTINICTKKLVSCCWCQNITNISIKNAALVNMINCSKRLEMLPVGAERGYLWVHTLSSAWILNSQDCSNASLCVWIHYTEQCRLKRIKGEEVQRQQTWDEFPDIIQMKEESPLSVRRVSFTGITHIYTNLSIWNTENV